MPEQIITTVHRRVLELFKNQTFEHGKEEYVFKIEEQGGRLDLPNPQIIANKKHPGQRKKSLCYTDTILVGKSSPRLLVEIVDSSPKSPNGITGLVVNADRIASFYQCKLDLLLIVLSEMKTFFCADCEKGHRLSTAKSHSHFNRTWTSLQPKDILHEGLPEQFRKSLCDYPIQKYLQQIAPPTVLFLNREAIQNTWDTYSSIAWNLIKKYVKRIFEGEVPNSVRLVEIEQLVPQEYKHLIPPLT